jgi:hypothetical protein
MPLEAKLDRTLTVLAFASVSLRFERLLRFIWRSQIDFLRRLHGAGGRLPLDAARQSYEEGRARAPQVYSNYSLEAWLQFLKSWRLIEQDANDVVSITDEGREFLQFLVQVPSPEPTAG